MESIEEFKGTASSVKRKIEGHEEDVDKKREKVDDEKEDLDKKRKEMDEEKDKLDKKRKEMDEEKEELDRKRKEVEEEKKEFDEQRMKLDEFFYHYTTQRAAKDIFLSGKILPSHAANGDAVHGDGVYLTTLEPRLGRETVMNNNWDGLAGIMGKEIDVYFEIFMPSTKVKRAQEKRDIQVYTGALQLSDYKWSLKNWDGELLATEHFMISSEGLAAISLRHVMGRYTLVRNIVMYDYCPVYKQDEGVYFLFRVKSGDWVVGPIVGDDKCGLIQDSSSVQQQPPSPLKTLPWKRVAAGVWQEDVTIKVYPCY